MLKQDKKVIIAAGGTGGHVFPAQALAQELQKMKACDVLFMGKGLDRNPYFCKDRFAYRSIDSATPFTKSLLRKAASAVSLLKGIFQASRSIRQIRPDLVIGFGSFHAFPVLAAAVLHKIPIILFESNSVPGKVNRLFSRWASYSAIQFSYAKKYLNGDCKEVAMPLWSKENNLPEDQSGARSYFGLHPHKFTLLVFGGSQGSSSINTTFIAALKQGGILREDIQVIHLTGSAQIAEEMQKVYDAQGILCRVKAFEEHMHVAWRAADFAICRAGAATLAELIAFEVPSILIPYPHATDAHQLKNARFMEEIGSAVCLPEHDLSELPQVMARLLDPQTNRLQTMKEAMYQFKTKRQKLNFSTLVQEFIQTL